MKRGFWIIPALWFVTTGCWIGAICVDFYYGTTPEGLVLLHWAAALASLAAAVVNLRRCLRSRRDAGDRA